MTLSDEAFHEFYYSIKKKDGRGSKECPECHERIGVRSFACKHCGYRFTNKKTQQEKQEERDAPTEEEKRYAMAIGSPGGRLVYVGSGSPPARLDVITPETVSDYCNLVTNWGIQHDLIYTVRAIKHFLQHQFGYNSGEYMSACTLVDMWYEDTMSDLEDNVDWNDQSAGPITGPMEF